MGAVSIPASAGGSGDKWVLVASNTSLSGLSAVNFSSISGYRKLFLSVQSVLINTSGNLLIRFNSDSNTRYAYNFINSAAATLDGNFQTSATASQIGLSTSTGRNVGLIIDSVDGTGIKPYNFTSYGTTGGSVGSNYPTNHYFGDGTAITSINLTTSANTLNSGSIYLYGVAA